MLVGAWNFYEDYNNNRMFLEANAPIGENLLAPCNRLYQDAASQGITLKTLDLLAEDERPDVYLFYDMPHLWGLPVKALRYCKPWVLVLSETEATRPQGWDATAHNLFTRVLTWNDEWVDNKKYFKLNSCQDLTRLHRVPKKNLCTLINSNKMIQHSRELYSARLQAINYFEINHPDDFDLYGIGWPERKSYRGRVESKLKVLNQYKFAICYENATYPGYITEKIFDCFKANCVPVYLGAPNIQVHIPSECFIDMRNFKSYDSLYGYLKGMDDKKYESYQNCAADFLISDQARLFSSEYYSQEIIRHLKSVV